jgi:competence protein ComGC
MRFLTQKQTHAFTLAEMVISLGLVGVLVAISIPLIFSSMVDTQEDAKRARIDRVKAELANGMNRFKMGNDPSTATSADIIQRIEFSRRLTTGSVALDFAPMNELGQDIPEGAFNFPLAANANSAYTMPFGGTLIVPNEDLGALTTCANIERMALRFIYDPDGRVGEDSDGIIIYLYEDASVRTLGTLMQDTCTAVSNDQDRVVGADPDFA